MLVDKYAKFIAEQLKPTKEYQVEEEDDGIDLVENFIAEMKEAKDTKITLGDKSHPMNKIPIEHHAEFKKQYPGVRTRYRGKRETQDQMQARTGGQKGKWTSSLGTYRSGEREYRSPSTQDTLKKDATHFYAHPRDIEAAGHKLK
jgi:hypothetical protein